MNITDGFANTKNSSVNDSLIIKNYNIINGNVNPSVIYIILPTENIHRYYLKNVSNNLLTKLY